MAPAVRSGSLAGGDVTVLYVDETGLTEADCERLEREDDGLTVVPETNLDGAVERLETVAIDCVVWRHTASGCDELEPLRIVRDRHGDLPFVLVTNEGSEGIASEALSAGADEHMRATEGDPILANRVRTVVERHRARTAARRTENRYRALADVDPTPVALFDSSGALIYINDSGIRMMNADGAAELVGKTVLEFVHPDDRAEVEERFERVVRESEALPEAEMKLLTQDGRIRHVRGATAPGVFRGEPIVQVALDDVTDYETTKRELRAERRLVGEAIDTLDDLFFVFDDRGRLLRWNDSVPAVTGYSDEVVGAMMLVELFVGDGAERVAAAVEAAFVSGSTTVEAPVATKGNEAIPYEFRIERLDEGRFCCVGRDVAERVEREGTLRALYQATRSLMTAGSREAVCERAVTTADRILGLSVNTVWLYDEEAAVLRPVAQSPDADELIGEPPTYAEGESLSWEAFDANELQLYEDVRDAPDVYNDGTLIRSELILPLGDYGVMNVGSPDPHRLDELDIQLARMLAANVEAGLERAEREALLEQERAFFEAAFDALDDLFYVFGPENTPIRWNRTVEEVTGYTDEEIGEMAPAEFFGRDEAERVTKTVAELIRTDDVHLEADLRTKDGERIPYQFGVTPLRDAGGRLIGIGGIGRDVTERNRRERELRRQNERLEEFASVVSHDLRNPMSVIAGRLELFDETRDETHLDAIGPVIDRIDELIDDLLTLARHGQVVQESEWISMADVVERSWTTVETGEATLETSLDDHRIEADGSRLQELIGNLLRNSVEHGPTSNRAGSDDVTERSSVSSRTESGDGADHGSTDGPAEAGDDGEHRPAADRSDSNGVQREGSLTVRVGPIDGTGFYVEDTGPGVPPDEREAVFESGYSTKGGGSGLGLAITRRIAEAHGWSVRLVEAREGGARFEFEGVEFE